MKVLIFCSTAEDELFYAKYNQFGFELTFTKEVLTAENASVTKGYEAVVIQTRCVITKEVAEKLKENGVKYCLTRSAGYDHMDTAALKECGIYGANVSLYSPNAIAEHVCMLTLMAIRNMKLQYQMIDAGDYSLKNIRGRELRNMTVGIIGAGRIGFETLKIVYGFTKDILVFDTFRREDVKQMADYVDLDTLYAKSDVIIFHCPLTKDNHHMVCDETIGKMKDAVVLINPARGGLWDYEAIERGLDSGKIAAAAFDVYEQEKVFLRKQIADENMSDELFVRLKNKKNVIFTAHSAFYTDTAIENMVQVTLENIKEYEDLGTCNNEVVMN